MARVLAPLRASPPIVWGVFSALAASVASGLICGAILNIFYVAVKHTWPENYFGLSSTVDPIISRNLPRYALFRFAPPLLIMSAAALTAARANGPSLLAVAIVLVLHAGRLIRPIIKSLRRARFVFAAAQALILSILILLGWLADAIKRIMAPLIPKPSDLVGNLWAGVVAAIGAVYVQRIALVKRDPANIARSTASLIPARLFKYAREASDAVEVNPKVVFSIMIAEDLQRPKWFRQIERLFPGPRLRRTLGIMQQRGARNDEDSIELAVRNYIVPAMRQSENIYEDDPDAHDRGVMELSASMFNPDSQFQVLVAGIYDELDTDPSWLSSLTD